MSGHVELLHQQPIGLQQRRMTSVAFGNNASEEMQEYSCWQPLPRKKTLALNISDIPIQFSAGRARLRRGLLHCPHPLPGLCCALLLPWKHFRPASILPPPIPVLLGIALISTSSHQAEFSTDRIPTGTPCSQVIANVLYSTFTLASASIAITVLVLC